MRTFLVVDASASMGYGRRGVTKLTYAGYLASAVAYLLGQQGDPAGLLLFDDKTRHYLPPSTRSGQVREIFRLLEGAAPAGGTVADRTLATDRRAGRQAQPGDGVLRPAGQRARGAAGPAGEVGRGAGPVARGATAERLANLSARGHDVVLFHLLDPDEVELPFEDLMFFEGMEPGDGRTLLAEAADLREAFREESLAFRERWRQACLEVGIEYRFATTDHRRPRRCCGRSSAGGAGRGGELSDGISRPLHPAGPAGRRPALADPPDRQAPGDAGAVRGHAAAAAVGAAGVGPAAAARDPAAGRPHRRGGGAAADLRPARSPSGRSDLPEESLGAQSAVIVLDDSASMRRQADGSTHVRAGPGAGPDAAAPAARRRRRGPAARLRGQRAPGGRAVAGTRRACWRRWRPPGPPPGRPTSRRPCAGRAPSWPPRNGRSAAPSWSPICRRRAGATGRRPARRQQRRGAGGHRPALPLGQPGGGRGHRPAGGRSGHRRGLGRGGDRRLLGHGQRRAGRHA